ncbi:hypothetical protein [Streptomyces europaeiscabiei]|uniref:hypothetical protein n=1 Tax=Streptomyces europaeiscabiei TaxID=146819 RepID=UPI0038D4C13B
MLPTIPGAVTAFHSQGSIKGAQGRGGPSRPSASTGSATSLIASVSATGIVRPSSMGKWPLANANGSLRPMSSPSGEKQAIGVRGGPGGA